MAGDGNCMFRSIAHQVWGSPEMHREVRPWHHGLMSPSLRCAADTRTMPVAVQLRFELCRYLENNANAFGKLVTEPFRTYLYYMRRVGEWGDHLVLLAAEEVFDRCAQAGWECIWASSVCGAWRCCNTCLMGHHPRLFGRPIELYDTDTFARKGEVATFPIHFAGALPLDLLRDVEPIVLRCARLVPPHHPTCTVWLTVPSVGAAVTSAITVATTTTL